VSGGARPTLRETNNQTQQRETPHTNSNTSIVKTAVGTALGTAAGLGLAGAGAYALLKHNNGEILNKIVRDAVTEAIKTAADTQEEDGKQKLTVQQNVDKIIQQAITIAINTAGQKGTVDESLKNIIRNAAKTAVTTAVKTATDKEPQVESEGVGESKPEVPGETRQRLEEITTELTQKAFFDKIPGKSFINYWRGVT
jgi:hypothetical protein